MNDSSSRQTWKILLEPANSPKTIQHVVPKSTIQSRYPIQTIHTHISLSKISIKMTNIIFTWGFIRGLDVSRWAVRVPQGIRIKTDITDRLYEIDWMPIHNEGILNILKYDRSYIEWNISVWARDTTVWYDIKMLFQMVIL